MDYKHQRKVSLLEVEEFFFNKVLSRDSSVGCSSHIFYYRSNSEGGVPFKWEMQPGTPKEPPKEDIIPPLSPPPAVLSLGLPKPSKKASILKSMLMFWKPSKKSQLGVNKKVSKESDTNVNEFGYGINFVNMEIYSSDGENFMASPRNSSSNLSSSTSLQSSSRGQSPMKDKIDALFYGGCSPWHVTSVLVRVGRRI